MKRFRGGLVFKAHRLVYHSTIGVRVIKKRGKNVPAVGEPAPPAIGAGHRSDQSSVGFRVSGVGIRVSGSVFGSRG